MNIRTRKSAFATAFLCLFIGMAQAQETALTEDIFAAARSARELAIAADAAILAPQGFAAGNAAFAAAEADFSRGRSAERISRRLDEAAATFEEARETSDIARITLAALIKTRDDASKAAADRFASNQWTQAEALFADAVRRLESGNLGDAREQANEAEALYRDAELAAIKAQYLSDTRALLAQATQSRVERYAPRTLASAEALLTQAEQELNQNRYDTDYPRSLAQQANTQARHAFYLTDMIQRLREQDGIVVEEELVLAYERPLEQVAAAADIAARLDAGPDPVVAELVSFIEDLQTRAQALTTELDDSRARVTELEEEIRQLDVQLGGVSEERTALVQRLEAQARVREQFAAVEQMFTREEARVTREGDSILLRLVGLSFATGSNDIGPEFDTLLRKVQAAADIFPNSQIIIEGHTDSYGGDRANLNLSRGRAESVSQYLADRLGIAAFRVTAVGYGETRPIANNETAQGRARNRRIDIRIEPQLE